MRCEIPFATAALALALPALAGAQQPTQDALPTPPPRVVEARADQELKKMCDFLAKPKIFALEAEETFDEIPDGEPKIELTNVRRVAVDRPNRLAADATGDTLSRASWYDGKTLTILDKEHNVYTTVEAAGTIDAMLDKLEDEYGVVLPLADLLCGDPYKELMERRHLRPLPRPSPGRGCRLPPSGLRPGDDRVADLDRRQRATPATQAGHQLRRGARRAAILGHHQALEPGSPAARRALHLRGAGGRAQDGRHADEAADAVDQKKPDSGSGGGH